MSGGCQVNMTSMLMISLRILLIVFLIILVYQIAVACFFFIFFLHPVTFQQTLCPSYFFFSCLGIPSAVLQDATEIVRGNQKRKLTERDCLCFGDFIYDTKFWTSPAVKSFWMSDSCIWLELPWLLSLDGASFIWEITASRAKPKQLSLFLQVHQPSSHQR